MKKTLAILILLFTLTSCVQNKTNRNLTNTTTTTTTTTTTIIEKTSTTTTKEKPTEILKENDYNYENISYLKDKLNNLTLKKIKEAKSYGTGRGGISCIPGYLERTAEESQRSRNGKFKYIYENAENSDLISIYDFENNNFGVGVTEKNELYFLNNDERKFLFDYNDNQLIKILPADKKLYFLIDSRVKEDHISPSFQWNFQKENDEFLTLYVYDIEKNEVKKIPNDRPIPLFKTKDRVIYFDFNFRFWLGDYYGNRLSGFYSDYIPELDFDDNIEKFIFVKNDIYPGEFCVVNKDGSILNTTKNYFAKYYNEDTTLKEEYSYYEVREYQVTNAKDFCHVIIYDLAYPRENPGNVSAQGDPRRDLLSGYSYLLDKKSGEMWLNSTYGINLLKINGEVKSFLSTKDPSTLEEIKINNPDLKFLSYIDYKEYLSGNSYWLSKDDGEIEFYIDCLVGNFFLLYDENFNLLEEIPYIYSYEYLKSIGKERFYDDDDDVLDLALETLEEIDVSLITDFVSK